MTLPDNLFLRFDQNRELLERGELPAPRHEDSILLLVMGLIFTLGGGLGVWTGMQHVGAGAALLLDGQPAAAEQMGRRRVDGDGTSYYITYAYAAAEQRHTREGSVSSEEWHAFCQGCPIAARYVARAPQISRLDTEWPIPFGLLIAGVTGIFAGIGLILAVGWVQDRRKLSRRKRGATLRLGTILDVATREDSDRDLWVMLHYQLDGADAPQYLEWMDNHLRDKIPAPGARLAFSYEADDNIELL